MGVTAIKHLTVVVDGSAASEAAVRYAGEFVRRAHVLGFQTSRYETHGGTADAIIAYAREHGSESIVIGTQAQNGVARSLGSAMESLMHIADRPVIVVHQDDVPRDGPIAVALSGYDAWHVVLDAAIAIATALGRELLLMSDITLPEYVASYPTTEENAATRLSDAADRAHAAGIKASITVGDGVGPVANMLISAAERRGCSMIVTGLHDRSGIVRLFVGSVAEKIVRDAHIPVAVVHHARPPVH